MKVRTDLLLSLQQMKNTLLRWKLVAVAALLFVALTTSNISVGSFIAPMGRDVGASMGGSSTQKVVAKIKIGGMILEDQNRIRSLKQVEYNNKYSALILYVNSPGGSAVESEVIYNALRRISAKKPVVVVMGEIAASGGYMAAIAADYVVAHEGTITGSIGVVMRSFNVRHLLKNVGVSAVTVKTSELKASPSPFEDMSQQSEQILQSMVDSTAASFVEKVSFRRNLQGEALASVADGRIFSARQALSSGLIDAIGSEESAVEWLTKNRNISDPVVDVEVDTKRFVDYLLSPKRAIGSYVTNALSGASDNYGLMFLVD